MVSPSPKAGSHNNRRIRPHLGRVDTSLNMAGQSSALLRSLSDSFVDTQIRTPTRSPSGRSIQLPPAATGRVPASVPERAAVRSVSLAVVLSLAHLPSQVPSPFGTSSQLCSPRWPAPDALRSAPRRASAAELWPATVPGRPVSGAHAAASAEREPVLELHGQAQGAVHRDQLRRHEQRARWVPQ